MPASRVGPLDLGANQMAAAAMKNMHHYAEHGEGRQHQAMAFHPLRTGTLQPKLYGATEILDRKVAVRAAVAVFLRSYAAA